MIRSVNATQISSSCSSSGWRLMPSTRLLAGRRVARRVELEPEARAQPLVALGPELRPGPGDREVDVEEDGAQHHAASSSQRAVSTCVAVELAPSAQATVCAIVQPRARSRSRPSSAVSRSKRWRTSALRVAELARADDRRDRELALADERLGVDREPGLALRREHVVAVQVLVERAPARPACPAARAAPRARRRAAPGRSASPARQVLGPPGGLVGERPERLARRLPEARQQLDEDVERGVLRPPRTAASPARSARAGARAPRRRAGEQPNRAVAVPELERRRLVLGSRGAAAAPSARRRRRRRPARPQLGTTAPTPAAAERARREVSPSARRSGERRPAVRVRLAVRAATAASRGSRAAARGRARPRSPSPRRAPGRARSPTGRRSASARSAGFPGSVSPTCAGAAT